MLNTATTLPAKTFGERLIEALEHQGITDTQQQLERVAKACGVTTKTAQKYLQAASCPTFLSSCYTSRFLSLADDLEVDASWLYCGKDLSQQRQVINMMRSMLEWEKSQYLRFVLRLRNNDVKAIRLSDMCRTGQISRGQLLAAM